MATLEDLFDRLSPILMDGSADELETVCSFPFSMFFPDDIRVFHDPVTLLAFLDQRRKVMIPIGAVSVRFDIREVKRSGPHVQRVLTNQIFVDAQGDHLFVNAARYLIRTQDDGSLKIESIDVLTTAPEAVITTKRSRHVH